jgi:hypothetical protein
MIVRVSRNPRHGSVATATDLDTLRLLLHSLRLLLDRNS